MLLVRRARVIDEPSTSLRLSVPVEPAAPRRVRDVLRTVDQIAEPLRPDLELLVTELVANVVRHARLGPEDAIEVQVNLEPEWVRAEVFNPGTRWPVPSPDPPRPEAGEGNYGLYLVSQIASRWGIDQSQGTRVWFELGRGQTLD
jgi:anti-sigma regulatory factor (Ser/Thr protein kinase)